MYNENINKLNNEKITLIHENHKGKKGETPRSGKRPVWVNDIAVFKIKTNRSRKRRL
jgi:hypothetical protein